MPWEPKTQRDAGQNQHAQIASHAFKAAVRTVAPLARKHAGHGSALFAVQPETAATVAAAPVISHTVLGVSDFIASSPNRICASSKVDGSQRSSANEPPKPYCVVVSVASPTHPLICINTNRRKWRVAGAGGFPHREKFDSLVLRSRIGDSDYAASAWGSGVMP